MQLKAIAFCCALGLAAPVVGAPIGEVALAADSVCGRPASAGAAPVASDALHILLAAVGIGACDGCVCDVDDSLAVTAIDALMVLQSAVGQPIVLECPDCSSTVTGLFEAPNPWNEAVETMAVSPQSETILQALEGAGGWGTGIFRIDFSIHLLSADSTTPRKTFDELPDYYRPDCNPSFPFPVPVDGAIEGHDDYACDASDEDCHLLVVERDEKRLYELYGADISSGTLSARCGVIWDLTRAYPSGLRGEQCTSADAAGLPIAALLFTPDEVAAGEIQHAIRFILPNARMRAGVYVHPATHAGAPSGSASLPPYGVRFRLRADYPVDSLANVNARVIARALQKYGMILSDGGNIALTAASDRYSTVSWEELGIDSYSLASLEVSDFEVLAFDPPIDLTYDCVRAD